MRAPTKSESLLLGVFGIVIVVLFLILGWQALQRGLTGQRQRAAALQGQLDELSQWVGQEAVWQERGRWLMENPLPLWQREASESGLVQELQTTLARAGINIINQSLAGTEQFGDFFAVTVQLTLRATTEELVRWLHATQQPGEFTQIEQLNLRADSEQPNLRAEVRLTRFFSLAGTPSDASTAEDEVPSLIRPTEEGLEFAPEPGEENPLPPAAEEETEETRAIRPSTDAAASDRVVPSRNFADEDPRATPLAPGEEADATTAGEEIEELEPAPVLPLDELADDYPDDQFTETLPAEENLEEIELLPVPRAEASLPLDEGGNAVNSEAAP
jgi:hypothetical protein